MRSFGGALRHSGFRRRAVVYGLSAVGQTFGVVAVSVAVFDQTGAAAWVGAVAAARLLPYVLLSTFGGIVADRLGFRVVMHHSAIARVVLCSLLALAVALSVPPVIVVLTIFALTACGTPCYPAVVAATTEEMPSGELAPANALLVGVETVAFVAGPAVGGLAILVVQPAVALALNAGLFVAVWIAARSVPWLASERRRVAGFDRGPMESEGHASLSGIRALVADVPTPAPVVLLVVVNLVYGASLVSLLLVAEDVLGTGSRGYSVLNIAFGVGGVVGLLLSARLARSRRATGVLAGAAMVACVPLALLAIVPWSLVAASLLVVAGAAGVVVEVLALTMIQQAIAQHLVARVIGVLDALVVAAICAGSLVMPVLVHAVGLAAGLVVVGAGFPARCGSRGSGAASVADGVRARPRHRPVVRYKGAVADTDSGGVVDIDRIPIAAVALQGRAIVAANAHASDLLRHTEADLVGMSVDDAIAGVARTIEVVVDHATSGEQVAILRDTTDERRLGAIVEALADSTLVIDRDGLVAWQSERLDVAGAGRA